MKRSTSGFTLIELITVISTISILTGVFLPAVQRAREQANREAAEKTLRQMAAALETQYRQKGSFPSSFNEQQTARNGYRFVAQQMQPKKVRLLAEPVAGVTGSQTGVLEINSTSRGIFAEINFVPTAGADEGRRRLLADVREECAKALGRMVQLALPAVQKSALEQSQLNLKNPITLRQSFDVLKNAESNITLLSTQQWTTRVGESSLWTGLARAMQLGAYGEDWDSLPGVSERPLNFSNTAADHLLNFSHVAELTTRWISDSERRSALIELLNAAAEADRAGNVQAKQAALAGFIAQLQSQADTEAETLITLARAL